jgi:amino acid transporter
MSVTEIPVREAAPQPIAGDRDAGLPTGVLGEAHVLAESFGLIGPSLSAAAIIPLAFAVTGKATWMTVALAMVGILALALVMSVLAKRYVSVGALYTFVPKGLGPLGGLLTGGAFVLCLILSGMSVILGFAAAFAQFLTSAFGIGHGSRPELILLGFFALIAPAVLTLRGIQLSTLGLLILEGISVVLISLLLLIVLIKHGHVVDTSQLTFHGTSPHAILLGMTFVVLSYAGFDSAASLGIEAKNPRRAIPIALVGSTVLVGVFYSANAYIQVLGFEGTGISAASQSVPLATLANHYGVPWLGDLVLLGVSISWFSVQVAWFNYGPRPLLAMANERVLPLWFSHTNEKTGVPVRGVLFCGAVWLAFFVYYILVAPNTSNLFSGIEALTGYGFTMMYLLMGLAALGYAWKRGFRRAWFVLAALIASAVMVLEFWYSFNPIPAYPLRVWVYIFGGFLVVMLIACVVGKVWARPWLRRVGTFEA